MEQDDLLGYVTLKEANEYISQHAMSTDELRIIWEALSDDDKATLLRKSFQLIELLPFSGRRSDPSQPSAFPRNGQETVPDRIKCAQIEQAFIGCDEASNEEAKQYSKMWQWGISSYSIGKLSESISAGDFGGSAAQTTGITSATASRLLAPFLRGGYRII